MLTNKIDQGLILLFHANIFNGQACFEHSILLTVNDEDPVLDNWMPSTLSPKMDAETTYATREGRTGSATRNPTTSFLTATTLVYAIGAGITAAAGTRLALQLILDKGFKLFSFQLPNLNKPGIVIYCHYLPVSGLGNLRACCLPWMW